MGLLYKALTAIRFMGIGGVWNSLRYPLERDWLEPLTHVRRLYRGH